MGFYQMRYRCNKCKEEWNTAFISVTPMQMARTQCPNPSCLSNDTTKIADRWKLEGEKLLEWEDD